MNWLLDALGDVGYALDTPGAYARGLLAGRPGERASGEEMLGAYGVDAGPLGGMAAEMVLDPLSLAAPAFGAIKGVQGINRGTRALAGLEHSDDVSPLVRGLAGFGDEGGWVDPQRVPELFSRRDNPMGRFKALAADSPVVVPESLADQAEQFGYPGPADDFYAMFLSPQRAKTAADDVDNPFMRSGPYGPARMFPNLNFDEWADTERMMDLIRRNTATEGGPAIHPDLFAVHELGHVHHYDRMFGPKTAGPKGSLDFEYAFKDKGYTPMSGWDPPSSPGRSGYDIRSDVARHLGRYAALNPAEFVAEAFASKVLNQSDIHPSLRAMYDDFQGPDPDVLPRAFWDVLNRRGR